MPKVVALAELELTTDGFILSADPHREQIPLCQALFFFILFRRKLPAVGYAAVVR